MKKLISFIFMALVFSFVGHSEAASTGRYPREIKTVGYSATVSSVTTISAANSALGVQQPGAVYAVILGTGTAGDFVVLMDSNSGLGYSSTIAAGANIANQLGPRLFYGSTTQSTVINFDPPIMFFNGLMVQMSAATNQVGVVYETGRGLSD